MSHDDDPTIPPPQPRRPIARVRAGQPREIFEENVAPNRPLSVPPIPPDPKPTAMRPSISNLPPPGSARPKTLVGMPAPPSEPPPRDSQEISVDSILAELGRKSEEARIEAVARRAAEKRAHESELKAAAAESGVQAQGPSLSLGSARWWVLVIGAIAAIGGAGSVSQVKEWLRPSISVEQLDAVRKQVKEIEDKTEKRDAEIATVDTADGKRWTITLAFLCSQGLRARGIDCDEAQKYADFQPMPLTGPNKVKGAPQWKATVTWPVVPVPKD